MSAAILPVQETLQAAEALGAALAAMCASLETNGEHYHAAAAWHAKDALAASGLGRLCDVSWCEREATLEWQRTAWELAAISRKGKIPNVQAVRRVCAAHRPAWRAAEYVLIGQQRKTELRAVPKAARKHCKTCACVVSK